MSGSPSGSVPVAVKFTPSGASPPTGVAAIVTEGAPFTGASIPQSVSSTLPAASSRPPRRCLRKSASAYVAWVWPMPVYHERPPS